MAKRKPQKGKLELLLKWEKRPLVDKMVFDKVPPYKIAEWINSQGFEISSPTVYKYVKKVRESAAKGFILTELNIKDKKNKTSENGQSEPNSDDKQTTTRSHLRVVENPNKDVEKKENEIKRQVRKQNKKAIKSDFELLDEIIQKGYNTLLNLEHVPIDAALKAVKLKNELTGGTHNGLTMYGIEEIRIREAAKASAIQCILMEYIPEEKHAEVIARMEEEERKYYEALGLGKEYERMKQMEEENEDDIEEETSAVS